MKINLTKEEMDFVHCAIEEALLHFERSRKHKEAHKDIPCSICKEWENLEVKFRKYLKNGKIYKNKFKGKVR